MNTTPERRKLINDWLAFAGENLLYAKDGLRATYSPYHTICFLCQGSAEKYLKGYLIFHGWELEKIHDLKQLLLYAMKYDVAFSALAPLTEILNRYITTGRYPGDLPFEAISKADAEEAIAAAEQIEKFVLHKLADFLNKPEPVI